ncbi:MAG: peptide chain release factor N(5)-glutamine methyltransferase [Proteobacteria bacterium]|nr:MAG: peptide chain release factor N(5)-glutamine methyltransferase [Pseudomonadota bacterium]
MTFEDALRAVQERLRSAGSVIDPELVETESEQILIAAFRAGTGRGKSFGRNDLYVRVMEPFPREARAFITDYLERRLNGEPLAYIFGFQAFLYHEYLVSSDTLIPRQETETLVFEAMQTLKRESVQPKLGLEFGIGTGCLSIELIKMFPDLKMIGLECSSGAIAMAEKNREKILGSSERFEIRTSTEGQVKLPDLIERCDFIISNPPYLSSKDEMQEGVWKFEPHLALLAPQGDALFFYRHLLEESARVLKSDGFVFFEIPHERADELLRLGSDWGEADLLDDLTGRPRVLRVKRRMNG